MKNRLFFGVLFLVQIPIESAAQSATVRVSPEFQNIALDSTAVVEVRIENVEHLRAYSIQVVYNSVLLRCINVNRLDFFPAGSTIFFSRIDSLSGVITVDEAMLGPSGYSGSGGLVRMRFAGRAIGIVSLAFSSADFRDTVNNSISTTGLGGTIQVGGPTEVRTVEMTHPIGVWLKTYPNPFNSTTTIAFDIPTQGQTTLAVIDILGHAVRVLRNEYMNAGTDVAKWDGLNDQGNAVASGVYFARLGIGAHFVTTRLVLLR